MKKSLIFILIAGSLALSGCNNQPTSFSIPSTNQSFGQVITYNNKVDILFVIDNSKSMTQHQQRLAARVPDMINALNALKMNYHVAVTTTTMALNSSYPMSRQIVGSPKYLTQDNIHLLSDRLLVGETGSDNERGLDALAYVTGNYAAVNAPGFLRSDALFVVNFLGDENDNSSEFGNGTTNDFINYMNQFRPNFKEGGRAWIANYIGTLQNQNCDFLGGHVSVGNNYINLANYSKGIKENICVGDLSLAVSNIKARIIDMITAFHLKDEPNKSTLRVAVGGVLVPENATNGWTLEYELDSNNKKKYFIQFHGNAIPAADQGVNVDYTPATAT